MKAETQALLARAHEDVTAARYLLEKSLFAHAVSDAYYAMFHAAKALLVEQGTEVSSHRGVLSTIGHDFVRSGRLAPVFGEHLHIAFDQRQRADCKVTDHLDEVVARECLEWAEGFIAEAEQILGVRRKPESD